MNTELLENTEPAFSQSAPSTTVWKQQDKNLWVGHRDGRCVGTIERGSKFIFVDDEATPRCVHRTLLEAEQSHSAPGACLRPVEPDARASYASLVARAVAAVVMTALFIWTLMAVL